MKTFNTKGMALVTTLMFVVVVYSFAALFILTTVNEGKMAKAERETAKTFYASHGAAQLGLNQMDTLINNFLLNTIANADPSGVINYATSQVAAGNGIDWLVYSVRDNNVPVLIQDGEQAEYAANGTIGNNNYQFTIAITEKENPSAVTSESWEFPYRYTIQANSSGQGANSNVIIEGDFTVNVQRDNFARFALFTNNQTTPSGSNVWFTDKTNFSGPVHTNGTFNFALNPSGNFDDLASQQEQLARFYNGGWPVLLDAEFNGTTDVPTFNNGFNRDAGAITLDSSTIEQDMVDQATGGQSFVSNGIYVPNNGTTVNGGIYVKGDSTVSMAVDGSNNPVYTISQGSTTKTITLNQSTLQTSVLDNTSGVTQTYAGMPDGVEDVGTLIYVEGAINSFSGTVQSTQKVTVASRDDIVINNHVQYADYTPGSGTPGTVGYVPPTAETAENLLGIVTWQGSVRIGTSAPNNVNIHGTVLASSGIFTVDNYTDQGVGSRGTATLLGGVITDDYGAFGQFNGSTGQPLSGYGRNFVYDNRMQAGQSPPYFPTLNAFVAFTNDITDKLIWREGQ